MIRGILFPILWLSLSTSASAVEDLPPADRVTFEKSVRPLLQKYCIRCHGEKKKSAELRIDRLGPDMISEKSATLWHELINRVNAGEMPPKNQPRLTQPELRQLTAWVHTGLKRVEASQTSSGAVTLRRLNRQEYNNTIRDLVGIPFVAGKDFPADPSVHGFDNIGSGLSISPLLLEKYVRAARRIIDRAIVIGEQPKRERWRIQAERRSTKDRGYYYENDAKYGNTGVFPREARKDRGRRILWALGTSSKHYPPTDFLHFGPVEKTRFRGNTLQGREFTFPVAGEYIIRVRAYGHYPKRKMSEHFLYGPPRLNVTSNGARVFTCDVPATKDHPQIYAKRFFTESLTTNIYIRNRYDFSHGLIQKNLGKRISHQSPDYPVPYLAVDWYEIDGPIYDSWPPASHKQILFSSPNRG